MNADMRWTEKQFVSTIEVMAVLVALLQLTSAHGAYGVPVCSSDSDCTSPMTCDVGAGQCCTGSGDGCGGDCTDKCGVGVPCVYSTDCVSGNVCSTTSGLCAPTCTSDTDCSSPSVCDTTSDTCCGDENGNCSNGTTCSSDYDCFNGACTVDTPHVCCGGSAGGCTTGTDCADDEDCQSGTCDTSECDVEDEYECLSECFAYFGFEFPGCEGCFTCGTCVGSAATPTPVGTPTPTPVGPVLMSGLVPGSNDVDGEGAPECNVSGTCSTGPNMGQACGCDAECGSGSTCSRGDVIEIFECTGMPPACAHTAPPDQEIGTCQKCLSGHFDCPLFTGPTLQPGEVIYGTDTCFDPQRSGPDVVIPRGRPAPALSHDLLITLAALLTIVGVIGLRRLTLRQ